MMTLKEFHEKLGHLLESGETSPDALVLIGTPDLGTEGVTGVVQTPLTFSCGHAVLLDEEHHKFRSDKYYEDNEIEYPGENAIVFWC